MSSKGIKQAIAVLSGEALRDAGQWYVGRVPVTALVNKLHRRGQLDITYRSSRANATATLEGKALLAELRARK